MSSAPRQTLHERVRAAILEAAARVLATGGEQTSMADVAAAAGVARATVYRYFPNRQALLDGLTGVGIDQAEARLRDARLDQVPLEQALERAVRALIDVGDTFVVLARGRARPDPEFDPRILAPLRMLVERGQAEGKIRDDVAVSWLTEALLGLVVSALLASPPLGAEDSIAATTSVFLDGTLLRVD
jgi:TetR/AcrR family transcriptional repressor of mexCD-oprJ operon